jgi:hypothetical protein
LVYARDGYVEFFIGGGALRRKLFGILNNRADYNLLQTEASEVSDGPNEATKVFGDSDGRSIGELAIHIILLSSTIISKTIA